MFRLGKWQNAEVPRRFLFTEWAFFQGSPVNFSEVGHLQRRLYLISSHCLVQGKSAIQVVQVRFVDKKLAELASCDIKFSAMLDNVRRSQIRDLRQLHFLILNYLIELK